MLKRSVAIACALLSLAACAETSGTTETSSAVVRVDAIAVSVPGHAELSLLAKKNEANTGSCNGGNVSPPVQWSHGPAATKSYAVMMSDPDGGRGRGSTHWIAYSIPLSTTSLAEGAGSAATAIFTHGKNQSGQEQYRGPCPSAGDRPHHYIIGVYALDLEPGALHAGLDREKFIAAVTEHSLSYASVVLLYAR
jgi:Raf kinase inhibitor-like YbhB/YbcL family protein